MKYTKPIIESISYKPSDTTYRDDDTLLQSRQLSSIVKHHTLVYAAAFIQTDEESCFVCVPDIKNCFIKIDPLYDKTLIASEMIRGFVQECQDNNMPITTHTADKTFITRCVMHELQIRNIKTTKEIEYRDIDICIYEPVVLSDPIYGEYV